MPNFIKALSVGVDLFHGEGRTDFHDEANGRFSKILRKRLTQIFLFRDSKSVDGNSLSAEHLETNPYLLYIFHYTVPLQSSSFFSFTLLSDVIFVLIAVSFHESIFNLLIYVATVCVNSNTKVETGENK